MMHAYDYDMMPRAQKVVGWMFDAGVHFYGVELNQFYQQFLNSAVSKRLAAGDASLIMGRSGRELAYDLMCELGGEPEVPMYYTLDRSPEFWLGWSLSYYQWYKGIPYSMITNRVEIETYLGMYDKYHEMDVAQFVDRVDELRKRAEDGSRLKRLRTYAGLSQKQLADMTGVPLRTIQQYEQRAKDINKANVEYVVHLARALGCEVTALLEEF